MAHHLPREPENLASIDDLLGGGREPEPAPDPVVVPAGARSAGWVLRAAAIAMAAAGAVYVVLIPVGYRIAYPLLCAGFFALAAVRRALGAVRWHRLRLGTVPAAPALGGVDPDEMADGVKLAVARWEMRLSWTVRDAGRYESVVRDRLAEIADERLRQRHGVTRASDPRRAREIMGERVWTFVYSPLARPPNRRELAAVVDDMEKI